MNEKSTVIYLVLKADSNVPMRAFSSRQLAMNYSIHAPVTSYVVSIELENSL